MDLGQTDEQQQIVASFQQLFAKESPPERVREAEPLGFDERLWTTLLDTGATVMAVPTERDGWGASMVDLVLVAEEIGLAAAPAPVIETQVAARLLARIDGDVASTALAGVLAGDEIITLALGEPGDGVARLVPAGAICDQVILRDGARLLLQPVDRQRCQVVANLAAAPLADLDVTAEAQELVAGAHAVDAHEAATDEWLTLTSAALVGLGGAALERACDYARERSAFGTRIGAFQGVSHPLADDATRLDGARLLARKAAWSIDIDDDRSAELAAMSFAFATAAAESATYNSLHTHGGYGFMNEYDVQLYYRRARGWSRVWGDTAAALRRAATARYMGAGS